MSLVCSDVVQKCEMDYSTRMVEWNRVGKGGNMSRFCYHMI